MRVYAQESQIVARAYNGVPLPPDTPEEKAATDDHFRRNRRRWR